MYKTIIPQETPTNLFHSYMLGAIAPRPIAFASTIDAEGNVNLSPFSFFNAFGSNPPTLIFSPARRVRDNTIKHTLENAYATKEVAINIVSYAMVEQMSLASCEYDRGVDEFIKAGFTPLKSHKIKPPRVAESPATFECIVKQIIETGTEGGAGNLIICEVVAVHIKEEILDEKGQIDPFKLDAVARMGGDWYCRANGEALFEVPKPNLKKGVGFDNLPHFIKNSEVLTGNNLGRLANIEQIPSADLVSAFAKEKDIEFLYAKYSTDKKAYSEALHQLAKEYLDNNELEKAWLTLLQGE